MVAVCVRVWVRQGIGRMGGERGFTTILPHPSRERGRQGLMSREAVEPLSVTKAQPHYGDSSWPYERTAREVHGG